MTATRRRRLKSGREYWKLNENNELANSGIGKAYLTAGDNKTAMKYLKLAMNRKYYSIAWRRYRNELMAKSIGPAFTVIAVVIIAVLVYRKILKKKFERSDNKKGGLAT